jgi:spore germination cell wall hydrolase CwlJ-like protein
MRYQSGKLILLIFLIVFLKPHQIVSGEIKIMPPTFVDNLRYENEVYVMALTIYGEAAGEPLTGKIAVGNVILNRVNHKKRWGDNVIDVCLAREQFSCFNDTDVNLSKLQMLYKKDVTNAAFAACVGVSRLLLDGKLTDVTEGATNYMTIELYNKIKNPKHWVHSDRMIKKCSIKRHIFFQET